VALQRLRVFLSGSIVACAFLMASAGETHAFSLFGITLFEDENAAAANAVIADPQAYTVEVSVTGEGSLSEAIQNASSLWAGKDAPASGAAGLLATARSDYRRIQSVLYDAGYYGGAISISVDGVEATRLPPDSKLTDPAQVAIRVETGPEFHFGTVRIVNQAPAADSGATPETADFVSGAVARASVVRRVALIARKAWQQEGHPKAEVADKAILADHKTKTLDVTLTMSPGPSAVIGAISVEGATEVNSDFIVRQTGLVPGRAYDPDDIVRARERLASLKVFGSIKIEQADAVGPDGTLPLTIVVTERKSQRVGAGANFSTTDGFGLETFWLHRNLFGEGERLKLVAKLAGISYPIDTSEFDYYFGGTFTKPGVITPDTDLLAELIAQRSVLTRYTETSIEGKIGLSHDVSSEIAIEAGIDAERANYFDTLHGTRDFTLLGGYGTLTYDTRNDSTDASSGLYAHLSAEPFYEMQYGNAGLLLNAEGRAYVGFGPDDKFVLAGRLKAGLLLGPSIAETPPDKLFFAGGGGSVRGYSYRSIGVDGPGGTVTGGKFVTEASIEARAKITDTIGLVGFVDAGYVTANDFVGLSEGTRVGVGAGLRYYTGFGPLRLDFAVPLNKRAGDPDYALYVGIGQAF
jgi:translocation and assembly module TamA